MKYSEVVIIIIWENICKKINKWQDYELVPASYL